MTETTGADQARGRFRPGQSGNPAGRPRGARHKATVLAEKLMADDVEAIVRSVISAARSGDLTAARLILDRLCPARKDKLVEIELPEIKTASDATEAMRVIVAGVVDGVITPSEAATLSGVVDSFVRSLEANEFEGRLAKLEALAG